MDWQKCIADLALRYPDCELPAPQPCEQLFDILCHSIVAQQLSAKSAAAISARITKLYPVLTPQIVNDLGYEQLRALGLSSQKCAYILDLCAKVLSCEIVFEDFIYSTNEDIVEKLMAVKGIGRWTAEIFLLFALGRQDVFPAGDYGLRQAFANITGSPTLPTEKQLREYTTGNPYANSYAALLFWRSLKNTN